MKTYFCHRIEERIKVDGDMSKCIWEEAKSVALVDTVTGGSPVQDTDVRLLWNDEFLYITFKCEDSFINATLTDFNDKLYEEEVVEIFIDDNCDKTSYIEIEVNPLNAVLDYMILNDMMGTIYQYARVQNNVISAVNHDSAKGIIYFEIAIPLKEFVTAPHNPPIPGDKWLMNLYRIDRPENGEDEYSAWSPTGKVAFHMPECFGELIFCE